MTINFRGIPAISIVALTAVFLAGCSSSRFGSTPTNTSQPETLTPVQTSDVQTSTLPPISGTDQFGNPTVLGPDGTVVTADTSGLNDPLLTEEGPFIDGDQSLFDPSQVPDEDGSFVSLDDMGTTTTGGSARDLTGGLTVAKLLGVWTMVSGADQCRLNLTQTAKSGTERYRASTPGCQMATLSSVASWQLAGSQVQLFNDEGDLIGALLLSGNRFVGTLAGGTAVSMVG